MSEWNAGNAGLSREWRPEGAPTTDEEPIALLLTKSMSVEEVNVLFRRLQNNITERCSELIAILSSTSI